MTGLTPGDETEFGLESQSSGWGTPYYEGRNTSRFAKHNLELGMGNDTDFPEMKDLIN